MKWMNERGEIVSRSSIPKVLDVEKAFAKEHSPGMEEAHINRIPTPFKKLL
ncbi:hypothetical protein J8I87_14025 [Paraburkholderia sp. LEh10]|uniref:hypothetical protein n=1 Tax=Paraburkholderia sp. LEh10 TaxID=2821353 RepID=UPI001AEA26F1|nr:hypothetical protein [Paraburkholderia sp. LEh10]MBP0590810.1 hypothetical protein [Paraburkholderia sp. LEh10]